jgi:flagellar basal body-associated protein FliL
LLTLAYALLFGKAKQERRSQMARLKVFIGVLGIMLVLAFSLWIFIDMAQRESKQKEIGSIAEPPAMSEMKQVSLK